ncbi:acetoin utilization protein AcuC, partial [Rhodococcus erythropolis]
MTASIRSDGDPAASRANRVVVWSPEYLSYRWSADHPMNPTRLDLTMALSRSLGLLEGIEFLEPSAASDADLLRIHTPAYLAAVKDAGNSANNGVSGQDVPHGLGTEDNPVFPHMHEA